MKGGILNLPISLQTNYTPHLNELKSTLETYKKTVLDDEIKKLEKEMEKLEYTSLQIEDTIKQWSGYCTVQLLESWLSEVTVNLQTVKEHTTDTVNVNTMLIRASVLGNEVRRAGREGGLKEVVEWCEENGGIVRGMEKSIRSWVCERFEKGVEIGLREGREVEGAEDVLMVGARGTFLNLLKNGMERLIKVSRGRWGGLILKKDDGK